MSTRCQIWVEGSDVLVYKHSDGYEKGTLPQLCEIVKPFMQNRGWDVCYLPAHIISHFIALNIKDCDEYMEEIKGRGELYPNEIANFVGNRYLGYGLDAYPNFHGDIEYIYIVKELNTTAVIEVRQTCSKFWDNHTLDNSVIIKVVDLDGKPIKPVKDKTATKRKVKV